MPPSFTCFLKVKSRSYIKDAVKRLSHISEDSRLAPAIASLTDSGLNHLLYRCENEERDISAGKRGTYGLSSSFPYAGITSFMHLLDASHDLGSELFQNLR